jgi:PTH1 family peptidyl-tRNA hydrolase
MLLFVGLGNPGAGYAGHRHNVGFMAVEAIRQRHNFPKWRPKTHGLSSEGIIGGEHALLLLPKTFMNESGRAVREVASPATKLDDIVVFHDEVELPPAKLRMKRGGGNAGHNGLRSITTVMGNDYRRVQIGVGHPTKNVVLERYANWPLDRYVLSDFDKSERPWVDALMEAIADNAELLTTKSDMAFEENIQSLMDSRGFSPRDPAKAIADRHRANKKD